MLSTMNKTAIKFLKWIGERKPNSENYYHRELARDFWDRYGEKAIAKAMKHSNCTSLPNFIKLCNHYLKNK